ncbi:putative RNA-directed DNA polymerase [Tanacetum coccineum]
MITSPSLPPPSPSLPPSSETLKKGNITMAMISAFTTVDKTAHNSRKFAFTFSPTNYGYWKTMIEPFLITINLMDYVDGSIPCPSKTLSVTDSVSVIKKNPNYPIWVSNDAHVRMLIISTILEASFRHVQGTTSRDLWLSLKKAYAPHSTSREYTLKTQLLRIKMHGDKTHDAYLNRAQEYADALAAIGEPVKDKDLVMLVVSGLREEYNGLKTTITARQSRDNGRQFDWASTQNTVYSTCNRCGIGHIPSQCFNRDPSTIHTRPSANFANTRAQLSNASANWHSDIGANSHVTPDLEAMDNSEAYYGDDALHVCNDESTQTTLLTGPSKYGLYTITLPQLKSINKVSFSAVRASPTIWHRRIGHPHQRLLHSMLSNFSLPVTNKSLSSFCNSCPLGKSSKLPLFESGFRSNNILDLVYCDVWGPAPLLSFEGHIYFMLCVDRHSRYMWIYHLAQKSDVYFTFKSFVQMVKRQFTTKLKNVQTNWGGEFRNLALFFSSLGINHRRSCPHISEQNGFVERRNRHVVETGLTLLAQACVPQRFWHYAFDTAVYLINRMPSRTSTNKSPFEHIFKRSPDYSFLRVFGCLCFPHLRPYNRHKMDFRSTPCVFLGYSPSHHGYHCLDISIERLYIARHFSHLSPTSQTSPESSNGQPSPVSITSIPTPPPPPITRQRPANLRQNPKQRVPYNPSANHATVLPTTITEPTSFTVANNSPEWRQAMKEEYDALMKNGTWSLVPRASNTNVVDGKWVYRLKRDKNGAITRYKARFVAKGFRQQPGIDFHETFSPVVKSTTIRAVLSLAVTNDWPLRQLDIQNAFLHGNLKEQVYMKQPPGFIDPQRPNHVCLLHKSLYGLKQAPRAWFERLSKALFDLGFKGSKTDPSLFIYSRGDTLLYILVYVDDIIVTGNNKGTIDNIICQLGSAFALKDLGPLNYFLGIEIVPHVSGILLSQKKYILELLQSVGLSNCNPVSSPMVTSSSLSLDDSTAFSNPVKYRQVVGSLQYVTLSRPDIAFAVNKVCQYMHAPTENHWSAVKRILRYLHGTVEHGMLIRRSSGSTLQAFTDVLWKGNPDTSLEAFSDADWAGDSDDRRSTGGFAIYLGSNLISWTARKQRTVSRSSTEAEYKALADTVAELTWLQALLHELGIRSSSTPILWCDNLGATYLSANPIFRARTKHVEIDYHFVREKVAQGDLRVQHISTHDQIADIFTKPLPTPRFLFLRSKLQVVARP